MASSEFHFDGQLYVDAMSSGGPIQKAVDEAVVEYMLPYAPTGELSTPETISGVGTGELTQQGSHTQARFLYYGRVMEGIESHKAWANAGEKKQIREPVKYKWNGYVRTINTDNGPVATNIEYAGGLKRGAFWFERMKADHLKDIEDAALEAAKKIV
jgi:hypothetical protein